MTKLWNACRFTLPLLADYDPAQPPAALLPLDNWLLLRMGEVFNSARKWLDQYETGAARREIDGFFWNDFCDFYIEMVKKRLYEPESQGASARRSGQYALYRALLGLLKLYAPFTPHITEYIYRLYFHQHKSVYSLHLLQWDEPFAESPAHDLLIDFGSRLKEAVAAARKYKTENKLSQKAALAHVAVQVSEAQQKWLAQSKADLMACTGAGQVD